MHFKGKLWERGDVTKLWFYLVTARNALGSKQYITQYYIVYYVLFCNYLLGVFYFPIINMLVFFYFTYSFHYNICVDK